jgi:1-aminocyclopropane-1-carboxylate deaminase/D-cysteine desulfhydrase-like pyridoxal-dependent ACC family enzyme
MIAGLDGKKKIIGFSVLRNGDFLHDAVRRLVPGYSEIGNLNWHIQTDFHFGGYARQTPELSQFILKMRQEHNLQLDPIYTGKMVAGVFDLVRRNHFARGSTILLIHTGGVRPD